MSRRADELSGEIEGQPQPPVLEIEVQFLGVFRSAPSLDQPHICEESSPIISSGRPMALPTVAQRALGPVADDRRAERGAMPAIGLIDPLDHLLAALMFEVDIDVRRSRRSWLTNRSNSRLLREGSIEVMPST